VLPVKLGRLTLTVCVCAASVSVGNVVAVPPADRAMLPLESAVGMLLAAKVCECDPPAAVVNVVAA
jgi:hypothetical protein